MKKITVFGQGNMGTAIGARFTDAGNDVNFVEVGEKNEAVGDIVVLAVPYNAVQTILEDYANELEGKIVVDITNPVDFATFDNLVVPADGSAAQEIAKFATKSTIVKAFNTTFAGTLGSKFVAGKEPTTVLLASDSQEAKETLTNALNGSGLNVLDAGALKRARELEAMGFLQITLAAREQITWGGGFAVLK